MVLPTQRNLDRTAAVLGLLAAVALLPVQLVIQHIYAQTIPVVLGVACLLYLVATYGSDTDGLVTMPRWGAHLLPSAVMFGTAALVLLSHLQGGRTRLFYGVAGLLGTLLLGQILFARERDLHPGVVLFQVFALGTAIRFAALDTTAGYIGIDVWLHVPQFTRGLLEANAISGMGDTKYVMAPFYHLVVAATTMFAGVSLPVGLVASLGVASLITPLFVYLTADLLLADRWALFAATLFALSDAAIHWSIDLIPTSLGIIFFVAILFLITRIVQLRTGGAESILLPLLFLGVALTHQVSSFILLVFLGAGWVTQLLIRVGLFDAATDGPPRLGQGDLAAMSFSGYLAFNAGLLTLTWSLTPYYGRPFLETVLLFLKDALFGKSLTGGGLGGGGGESVGFVTWAIQHFHLFGFLLFLFGTTVGSLYAFEVDRRNQAVLTFVVGAVVMTVFTLVPPLVGVGTFLPGRWYVFLYAVMAVLVAVGFEFLRGGLSPVPLLLVLLVFLYAFPTVMIASPNATLDAPALDHEMPSLGYTEEEMAAMETITARTTGSPQDHIDTDFPYVTVLNRVATGFGPNRFDVATVPRGKRAQGETAIYREYQTTGAPQFENGNQSQRVYRIKPTVMCGPARDTIYANGDVRLCSRP